MWVRRVMAAFMVMASAMVVTARAQEVVTSGPPPELRAHMDALVKAFNTGSDADWEAMAKTAFTPDWLKRQTPADRKKLHADLKAKFGTIAVQGVMREGGPDAPIQVTIKGSVASGTLWIDLDESSRFDNIKGEVQKTTDEDRRH